MAERNEHKGAKYQDGDIYLNPCFGDLWVVDGASFIKINNGYAIELDEPEGFIKVGHIVGGKREGNLQVSIGDYSRTGNQYPDAVLR